MGDSYGEAEVKFGLSQLAWMDWICMDYCGCISVDFGFVSNCSWMGAVELPTCCLQVTLVLRCVSSLLNFIPQVGYGVLLLGSSS